MSRPARILHDKVRGNSKPCGFSGLLLNFRAKRALPALSCSGTCLAAFWAAHLFLPPMRADIA
jgi:hypothetical protein